MKVQYIVEIESNNYDIPPGYETDIKFLIINDLPGESFDSFNVNVKQIKPNSQECYDTV